MTCSGTCFLKATLCPCILTYQSIGLYFGGCLGTYSKRITKDSPTQVGKDGVFQDPAFPATAASIGAWKGMTPAEIDERIEWRRLSDVCGTKHGAPLFKDSYVASDVCQGQLGDCWLLSSLASLAHLQGLIQHVFLSMEYNAGGRYSIQLFNKVTGEMNTVVVDDRIPCSRVDGKTMFARPQGEAWVVLLEKAIAKYVGSYAAIEEGSILWGLEALTNGRCFKYLLQDVKPPAWKRYNFGHAAGPDGKPTNCPRFNQLVPTADKLFSNDDTFETIRSYLTRRAVIAASSVDGSNEKNAQGIILGHAYSIMAAREVEGFKLLQMRNPWGYFEWNGDWSDHSPLWKQNPKVAAALDFTEAKDDGTFWMEFKDLCKNFLGLNFCEIPALSQADRELEVDESMGCCG